MLLLRKRQIEGFHSDVINEVRKRRLVKENEHLTLTELRDRKVVT